jgi:putative ATP-dependent endonuclease of OLD family
MHINKLVVENFKSYKEKFILNLNPEINIIVGDNEAGKSTLLEVINLALTGLYHGRYIRNELSQYLFNESTVKEYIANIKAGVLVPLPSITIELYFDENEETILLKGTNNIDRIEACGVQLKIEFNDIYSDEYSNFIRNRDIETLPIEYYQVSWKGFSKESITARSIPLKAALIDSSSTRYQNGSDIYISRIIKEFLTTEEIVSISQAHRMMKKTLCLPVLFRRLIKRLLKPVRYQIRRLIFLLNYLQVMHGKVV